MVFNVLCGGLTVDKIRTNFQCRDTSGTLQVQVQQGTNLADHQQQTEDHRKGSLKARGKW